MHTRLKTSFVIHTVTLLLFLLLSGAALAQNEGTAEAAQGAVPGISTFIFFIGAGAILLVGVTMMARDRFKDDTESN